MFYEIYGELDVKKKFVQPRFLIKKEKQKKDNYLIKHFEEYESNVHQSIVSFLNVILELENHPDYEVFLKVLLEASKKVINNKNVHSQCTLTLDFNYLMQTFIKKKKDNCDLICKVNSHKSNKKVLIQDKKSSLYFEAFIQETNTKAGCFLILGSIREPYSSIEYLVTNVLTRSVEEFKKENLKKYLDNVIRRKLQ